MNFTYYGDLLGISGLYKLSPEIAYEKLNLFYNMTFASIDAQWQNRSGSKITMFSDSVLMWGNDAQGALRQLASLYTKLLAEGLLLRGAIVKDKLTFDPRLERRHFEKRLPTDNTLARAVGLESTHKGARLLIESPLANALLRSVPQWATAHGYITGPRPRNPQIPHDSVLRRIAPTPEGYCYELLYFWDFCAEANEMDVDYKANREQLEEVHKMLKEDVGIHYKETVSLLKRCEARHAYTQKKLTN
jgi:hypothetical protein